VEVWFEGRLAGGLYGIAVGSLFAGESMFHTATGASKVAFARMVERLRAGGFRVLDVQVMSAHLKTLGCVEMRREEYLRLVERCVGESIPF
jgi:leucyl/phenylalanyl-tRNA--protein transferase